MSWWILVTMIVVAILATTWASAVDNQDALAEPDAPEEGSSHDVDERALPAVPETTA